MSEGVSPTKSRRGIPRAACWPNIQGALPPHTPPPLRARSLCSYDTAQFAKTRPPRAACRRLDKPNTLVLHHSDIARAVLVSNRVFLRHSDTVRVVLVSNRVFLQHLDTVRVVLASRTSIRIVSSGLYIVTSPTSTLGVLATVAYFAPVAFLYLFQDCAPREMQVTEYQWIDQNASRKKPGSILRNSLSNKLLHFTQIRGPLERRGAGSRLFQDKR